MSGEMGDGGGDERHSNEPHSSERKLPRVKVMRVVHLHLVKLSKNVFVLQSSSWDLAGELLSSSYGDAHSQEHQHQHHFAD